MLTEQRLCSADGTRLSVSTLSQLRRLTAAHKEVYSKVVLAATAELASALVDMPTEMRDERQVGLVSSINWRLNAQAEFYANRERWLDAAEEICFLIESRRETCSFSADGVDLSDDDDLARFSELLNIIQATQEADVTSLQERLARLSRSAAVLGIGSPT